MLQLLQPDTLVFISLVSLNAFLHFLAEAPGLNSQFEGKPGRSFDVDFEERLETIRRCVCLMIYSMHISSFLLPWRSDLPMKVLFHFALDLFITRLAYHFSQSLSLISSVWWTRSALEKKKTEVVNEFGPIDYDAPVQTDQKTIGLGTQVHTNNIFQLCCFLFFFFL